MSDSCSDIKVLHVIDHLGLGGAQVCLLDIVSEMPEVEHHVLALRSTDPSLEIPAKSSIILTNSMVSPAVLLNIVRLVRSKQINIIHAHLFRSQLLIVLLKLLKQLVSAKFIFHEHGNILFAPRWQHFCYRRARKYVDRFVVVSKVCAAALKAKVGFSESEICILPTAINSEQLKATALNSNQRLKFRKSYGVNDDIFWLGFAGRLEIEKSLPTLINAMSLVSPKIKLAIVGSGSMEVELREHCKRVGVSERVQFLGFHRNIVPFFCSIDALVLPSVHESWSRVIREALSFACPVIVSAVDGNEELISKAKCGLLFEHNNAAALAHQIKKISSDPALLKKLKQNAELVCSNVDFRNYIKVLNQVYNSALCNQSRAS